LKTIKLWNLKLTQHSFPATHLVIHKEFQGKKVRIRQFDQEISLKENILSISPVITQMPSPLTGSFHIYQMP